MDDIEKDSYQWHDPRDNKAPDLTPYADLERALAEKDREIEEKDTELGKLDAELIVSRASYQQLMEQAVRFAKAVTCKEYPGIAEYIAASNFLKSPEVQARKEHR